MQNSREPTLLQVFHIAHRRIALVSSSLDILGASAWGVPCSMVVQESGASEARRVFKYSGKEPAGAVAWSTRLTT
jgi:hypothetical protein